MSYWWFPFGLSLAFVAITAGWLATDSRVPDFDSGRHLFYSWIYHDKLRAGDLTAPFTDFNNYPPLTHLVGGLVAFVAGVSVPAAVLTQNIFFVPLLALGVFGAANIAFGPRAAVTATIFALGTPMVVSTFHVYMLDAPQAALIAISVWLLLASERFAKTGISVAGGVAVACAQLSKQTSLIFVAGLILVMLLRGGWKNLRGAAAFAAACAVVGAPWYFVHLEDLRTLTEGATSGAVLSQTDFAGNLYPPRWSTHNFGWYFWNAVNVQILVPFTLIFLTGLATALWQFGRFRRSNDFTPELVAGGAISWFAITLVTLKDPRYILPALVYIAIFAAAPASIWRRRGATAWTVVVSILAAANTVAVTTGFGSLVRVGLPDAPRESIISERSFTLWQPTAFPADAPRDDGGVLAAMRASYADGIRTIEFDPGASDFGFNGSGLTGSLVLPAYVGLPSTSRKRSDLARRS